MDVTCERCGTEYDFDDALVSERGTTVKCTNCDAQFRVFRPVPAAGPERWVVRTVDGRELTFSALRELQAAISTGMVGRDDVLSRGGGRPRRLGSIAELEPFFKQAIVVAATSTSPGLGSPGARAHARQSQDASAPFALPRGSEEPPPKRSGTLPPPPPILNMPAAAERSDGRARGTGDQVNTHLTGSVSPSSAAASGQAARLQNLVAADLSEPITMPRTGSSGASLGQADLRTSGRDRTLPVPIGPPPNAAPSVVAAAAPAAMHAPIGDATIQDNAGISDTIASMSETRTEVDRAALREPQVREAMFPPPHRPEEAGVVQKQSPPQQTPVPATDPPPAQRPRSHVEGRLRPGSIPPITPSPGDVRISHMPPSYVPDTISPRFSTPAGSKRSSSVRWIVGVVLVGATALLATTVGRKYFTAPAPVQSSAPVADSRVAKLLEDGARSLREGDLESAKEQLDKASVLAENDAQVAAQLAYLAVVRADFRWLKVRILPPQAPETVAAQGELGDAVEKMKKAVEAARVLSPNDAPVRRYRVDALRIAGDRAGARKLVAELSAAGKTPEDDLTLAALDLAEEKPAWPTVIERLRSAAGSDGNLGRARAMLVYALASSGDAAGAKAEYDRLAGLSRPHPLKVPLLAFMANVEIERPAATGSPLAASLPVAASASARPSAGAAAGAPATTPPQSPGTAPSNGRVADDYVAPNAGSVDVSDMHNHPAPQPTAPQPTAPPTQAPAPAPTPAPTTPPAVDTSDLPGLVKP